MAEYKVGGEVDAYCTRCKLELAHTILAVWADQIKRVRCNTCMGEHAFRRSQSGEASARASPAPRATGSRPSAGTGRAETSGGASTYSALIAGKDRANARRYDPKEKYEVGDVVSHPAFGVGVVAAVRGLEKVDIAFPSTVKTLLHARGSGPQFLAKPPPPRTPDVAVDESREDPTADTSDE